MIRAALRFRHSLARVAAAAGLGAVVALVAGALPARAEGSFDHGLLWQIDVGNGTAPSYLFGTIHIADPRVTAVPDAVSHALAASDTAVFEVLIDKALQTNMAKTMMLGGGRTLDDIIGPDLFEKVKKVGRSYGLIPSVAKLYKPWALVMVFSMPPEEVSRLAHGQPPLDSVLQSDARQDGDKLAQLETAQEQIEVLDGLSESDQVALLASVLNHKDELDKQFHELIERYLDRDLAGIAAIDAASPDDTKEEEALYRRFNERLLKARNDRMFKRLLPMLAKGGVFVAVGAMHLSGDDGLLSRLAGQGYTITRVY